MWRRYLRPVERASVDQITQGVQSIQGISQDLNPGPVAHKPSILLWATILLKPWLHSFALVFGALFPVHILFPSLPPETPLHVCFSHHHKVADRTSTPCWLCRSRAPGRVTWPWPPRGRWESEHCNRETRGRRLTVFWYVLMHSKDKLRVNADYAAGWNRVILVITTRTAIIFCSVSYYRVVVISRHCRNWVIFWDFGCF